MKKVFILISVIFLFTKYTFPQALPIEENFDYTAGVLTSLSTWEESPTGSTDIEVISGSLSYTNYPSSSVGNKIFIDGGAAGRSGIRKNFTTISGDGNTVYASFLLEVIDLSDLDIPTNEGDYFFNFQTSSGSANKGFIYIKQSATANKFNIGLAKSSAASLTYSSIDLDINTTYLIVVSYILKSGSDEVKLWINPDLSGAEPVSDVTLSSGTEADDIAYIQFRQRELSGNINVDGVRAATSWSLAPLPVELTSFTASLINNQICLNWKIATELNNYGYEVQRSSPKSSEEVWETISFVKGYGNSNSTKEYEYVDKSLSLFGKYFYRLKQLDTDGSYEYSDIIEIDFGKTTGFELFQNYPNPFNSNTIIKYQLPEEGFYSLKIFDVLGNNVKTLVEKNNSEGIYEIIFDASDLTSGIYFYQLRTKNYSSIKKLILLK